MRVTNNRFDRYESGATDFLTVLNLDGNPKDDFETTIQNLVDAVSFTRNLRVHISVIGQADRQDDPSMTCDQQRQSEIDASGDRATSAWEYIQNEVASRLVSGGFPAQPDWYDTSPNVSWFVVPAGACMRLTQTNTEEDRARNRRVDILSAVFEIF